MKACTVQRTYVKLIYAKKSEKIGNQHGEDLGGWVLYNYLHVLVQVVQMLRWVLLPIRLSFI